MATSKPEDKAAADKAAADKAAKAGARRGERVEGEIRYFDGTVIKTDAEGRDVMSDHLAPGETLRREHTDRYTAVRATPPRSDLAGDKKTGDKKTGDKPGT